jgi:hypothetical protein
MFCRVSRAWRYLLKWVSLRVTPTRFFGGTSGTTISSIEHVQIPGRRPTNLNLRCQEHKSLVQLKSVFGPSAMPSDIRSFFGGGGPRLAEATAKTTTVNLTFSSLIASQPPLFANCCGRAGSYTLPHPSILRRYKPAKNCSFPSTVFSSFSVLEPFPDFYFSFSNTETSSRMHRS